MSTISIVGIGRLGGALALALDRAGFTLENLIYRTEAPSHSLTDLLHHKPTIVSINDQIAIGSDMILITTQDSQIAAVSQSLRALITSPSSVFITSGAISSSVIAHFRDSGCTVGSIHPLLSVSDPILGADRFQGAYFCVEGDGEAVKQARSIVDALKGHSFTIKTDKKALYHAAAVTASGDVTALIDMAIGMLEKCGLERDAAGKVLLPLITSTVENLAEQGIEASLTGPFKRGDIETFERHLETMKANTTPDELEIYLNLGKRSLEIALRLPETDHPALAELREKVSMAKKESR